MRRLMSSDCKQERMGLMGKPDQKQISMHTLIIMHSTLPICNAAISRMPNNDLRSQPASLVLACLLRIPITAISITAVRTICVSTSKNVSVQA